MTQRPRLLPDLDLPADRDDAPKSWRLDAQTREIGRRGVARARAVLAAHRDAAAGAEHPDHTDPAPRQRTAPQHRTAA